MHASCFCGHVRFRLMSAPMIVHCCHCTDCQVQSGGAFAINALIERDRIELLPSREKPLGVEGAVSGGAPADGPVHEPVRITMPTDSGRPHDVYRCPRCATALWSDYGRRGVMVFVRVSTLEEPHSIVPDMHIFTRSKVPWVQLPPDQRAFDIYYDMQKEWPPESLARREALLGPGK